MLNHHIGCAKWSVYGIVVLSTKYCSASYTTQTHVHTHGYTTFVSNTTFVMHCSCRIGSGTMMLASLIMDVMVKSVY